MYNQNQEYSGNSSFINYIRKAKLISMYYYIYIYI